MKRKVKVTEEVWKLVKASKGRAKNYQVAELLGISKRTVGYIHKSDSYDEYIAGIKERSNKHKKRKLEQPTLAMFSQSQDESGKGYISFYGDVVELSRLAGIASVLGIEECAWTVK